MNKLTPLCKIAFKYGTDKCRRLGHNYTPVYYKLFKDKRKKVKKVLELGVGCRETMHWIPDHYQNGASLLMWRDFFPNAHVYGVDIDPRAIFQAERITSFLLDTRDNLGLAKLIHKIGTDIDLVIDDGNHNGRNQIFAVRTLLPFLKKDSIYIVEDARNLFGIRDKLSRAFDCQVIGYSAKHREDALLAVRKR